MTATPRLLGERALGDRLERLLAVARPGAQVVGWATIDLDRLGPGVELPDDDLLGARVRRLDETRLALEPATEGRLAAALARHGEGPLVLYVIAETGDVGDLALTSPANGPLGRQRLVLGGPIGGPHLVVVAPATIEP